jgi:hypothetical protein
MALIMLLAAPGREAVRPAGGFLFELFASAAAARPRATRAKNCGAYSGHINAVGEGAALTTSHSNRSLRTGVSVAGKRNFQGRDKEAETALEIQGRRCGDKISLGNSANSGLIAGFREISVRTRMRGGASRTRTWRRLMMSRLTARSPKSSCYARPDLH